MGIDRVAGIYRMLQTTFLNITFRNPLILASGIMGVTAGSMKRMADNGFGGVTVKSYSKLPRAGHPNPTMIGADRYFLNAVGLSNPGVEEGANVLAEFKKISDAPLIGSIFAGTADEFADVAETLSRTPMDMLELDLSCPNVGKEFGEPFAYSAPAIEAITKKVKQKTRVPILVKLSPNAWNIGELAKAAEAAGADAITAVNTVSAMTINVRARRPVLHNKQGGMSGPALFPIALKCVYDVYEAVKIPIIGTGGVTTGEDAIAMVMAGATLVGVGSALYFRGPDAGRQIEGEMKEIMAQESIATLNEIRGAAHA